MKKLILIGGLIFCMFALASCSEDNKNTDEPDAPADEGWIDPIFAQVLEDRGYIAYAEYVTPSDVANIEKIDVSGTYENPCPIKSVRGLRYFTSLKEFRCSYNKLTTLDVSENTQLTTLYCRGNQLRNLDASKNTKLTSLDCRDNLLTSLDVLKNTELTNLWCDNNQLTALDVSKNAELTQLWCSYNQLTTLDVSKNSQLTRLSCYGNQLSSLNISKNAKLERLDCYKNPGVNNIFIVTALFDSSEIPNNFTKDSWEYNGQTVTIEYHNVGDWINPIFAQVLQKRGYIKDAKSVTPSDVANIERIDVSGSYGNRGPIKSVKGISYFTSLKSFDCGYNQLTSLDVSNNVQLTELNCEDNQLTALEVSKNAQLKWLFCQRNKLTTLDISKNAQLTTLICGGNQLKVLDVSNNAQLQGLNCYNNQLRTLDISKNTQLTTLTCGVNPGVNNKFIVSAWFDSSAIPKDFDTGWWLYNGQTVTIQYKNVI